MLYKFVLIEYSNHPELHLLCCLYLHSSIVKRLLLFLKTTIQKRRLFFSKDNFPAKRLSFFRYIFLALLKALYRYQRKFFRQQPFIKEQIVKPKYFFDLRSSFSAYLQPKDLVFFLFSSIKVDFIVEPITK